MTSLTFKNNGTLAGSTSGELNAISPLLITSDNSLTYAALSIDPSVAPVNVPFPDVSRCIIKTADETVNNSNTLQNDDHLAMSLESNAVYFFELFCRWVGTATTHDAKVGWTVPTGTTMEWGGVYGTTNNQSTYIGSPAGVSATPNQPLGAASVDPIGSLNGSFGASWGGYIFVSSTAGTLQLQWAQNTAVASNLTLKQYSLLRLFRIA